MIRHPKIAVALLALAAAACSKDERPKAASALPVASATTAASGWAGRERVGDAIKLLNAGDPAKARKQLKKVLATQPGDTIAARLLAQIDGDPAAVLPKGEHSYRTRPGDTMSDLADRFLGDPLLFYALARMNGIAAPGTLAEGTALRIPGAPPRPAVVARPTPAREKPATPAQATAQPTPQAPARNPARATRLRASALAQMNRGRIQPAVALLRQALAADPASTAVRRDLDRALRIQRTVGQP